MADNFAPLTAALSDRYRIERELGQGGMVRRLVAEATATERPSGACQRDPGARESFRARLQPLTRRGARPEVASATAGWPRADFSRRPQA